DLLVRDLVPGVAVVVSDRAGAAGPPQVVGSRAPDRGEVADEVLGLDRLPGAAVEVAELVGVGHDPDVVRAGAPHLAVAGAAVEIDSGPGLAVVVDEVEGAERVDVRGSRAPDGAHEGRAGDGAAP